LICERTIRCFIPAFAAGLSALLFCAPAQAARVPPPIACARIAGGGGEAGAVTGPLSFKLADGTEVALSEAGVPAAAGAGANPAADAAREALKALVQGKPVRLYYEPAPALREDRHGRRLVQVLVGAPGTETFWLQARLVEDGAALVDSWATNRACAAALLALEDRARADEQGLWADNANAPLPADRAGEARGRFALIEGEVLGAKKFGARIYLDFAEDWRRGFGVVIDAKAARLFTKAGIDPLSLKGARVRVRGYVDWGSGPEIAVTHPEMLEVIARPASSATQH
jgi:endonuclease YncB( thermonuclease family)